MIECQEERQERNRKWRERKDGRENLEEGEEKELDENEKRKQKNREWRLKRERESADGVDGGVGGGDGELKEDVRRPVLLAGLLAQLCCSSCSVSLCEAAGPGGGRVWQCQEGHNVCWQCCQHQPHLCPLCYQPIIGLNRSLMAVAQVILGGKYKYEGEEEEEENNFTDSSSMDFTLRAPEEEEEDSLDFAEPVLDSFVEVKQLDL